MQAAQSSGMTPDRWISFASLIVAFFALISPGITAFFNNCYALKMKKLEYEHIEKQERKAHEREIYEGYIRAAGACIQAPSYEARLEYGNHSALVAYFVPSNIREDILKLEKIMPVTAKGANRATDLCIDKLAHISEELRKLNGLE